MSSESIEQRLAKAMAELEATEAAVARAEGELAHAEHGALRGPRRRGDRQRTGRPARADLPGRQVPHDARRSARRERAGGGAGGPGPDGPARHGHLEPFTKANPEAPEITGFDVDWNKIFGPGVLEAPRPADGAGRPAPRRDQRRPGGLRRRCRRTPTPPARRRSSPAPGRSSRSAGWPTR
ncbi:YbaB/EbfC family nucleoid-associated protein [Streptomyces sp. L7]